MSDTVYWSELGLALRPMIGAAVVLAAFCAACMTLAGISSPVHAAGSSPALKMSVSRYCSAVSVDGLLLIK